MVYTLDLNDTRLRVFRDLEVVAQSPGFAIIGAAEVLLGDTARGQFRLNPRQANNQFWHRLNMDPLATRGPNVANHADLVYRHLKELLDPLGVGADDELILAVSGTTTNDQLGLLLGVAQELNVTICGLVDSAIAASATGAVPDRVVHIDVSLHRATLTMMDADSELVRRSTAEVPELGLSSLLDAWVNVIADRFVTETRFDPLRIAETEQQVYDRVYGWADSGAAGADLAVEVEHQGNLRRAGVSTKALTEKAQQRYRALDRVLEAGAPCILSHRAAGLPGLDAYLTSAGHSVTRLGPTDVIAGVQQHLGLIRSAPDALRFVTRLPRAERADATPGTLPRAAPTHVVCNGVGVAIGAKLTLTADLFGDPALGGDFPDGQIHLIGTSDGLLAEATPGTALTLNGAPLEAPRALRRGDELEVGDHRLLLIRIDDGT